MIPGNSALKYRWRTPHIMPDAEHRSYAGSPTGDRALGGRRYIAPSLRVYPPGNSQEPGNEQEHGQEVSCGGQPRYGGSSCQVRYSPICYYGSRQQRTVGKTLGASLSQSEEHVGAKALGELFRPPTSINPAAWSIGMRRCPPDTRIARGQ